MTTADCADILNELCGCRVFDDRVLRQRVEDGELQCINPVRRRRERIKIGPRELLAYVAKYHPQLLEPLKRHFSARGMAA